MSGVMRKISNASSLSFVNFLKIIYFLMRGYISIQKHMNCSEYNSQQVIIHRIGRQQVIITDQMLDFVTLSATAAS